MYKYSRIVSSAEFGSNITMANTITMANKHLISFLFLALAGIAFSKCAPRTIRITYKAPRAETIQIFKMCGIFKCGAPVLTLNRAACTRRLCRNGARCNTCWVTLKATDLVEFHGNLGWFWKVLGKYGVKFASESCPFLTITSDWRSGKSAWFAKNGFNAGCKPRVACRTRGGISCRGTSPFDVAVTAAGCYTNLYGRGNAPSISQCLAGNIAGGVPSGEVYGVACPARPL